MRTSSSLVEGQVHILARNILFSTPDLRLHTMLISITIPECGGYNSFALSKEDWTADISVLYSGCGWFKSRPNNR
jgi:hypothetical protein